MNILRRALDSFKSRNVHAVWEPYGTGFRKVTSIDGHQISGIVMRRRLYGEWQYREMTPDEYMDYSAW